MDPKIKISTILAALMVIGLQGIPTVADASAGSCGSIFAENGGALFERSQIDFDPRLGALMPLISFESIHQRFQHLSEGSELPSGYKVAFSMEESQSYASFPEKRVSVGLFAKTDLATSAKATEVVFAHEMSHAIFDHNLRKNLPEYREHKNKLEPLLLKSQSLEQEYRENIQQMSRLPDGPQVEAIQSRNLQLETELVEVSKQIKAYESLERLIAAYHELYADIGAVLVNKDPQIMAMALRGSAQFKDLDIRKALLLRDFTLDADQFQSIWQKLKSSEVDQKGDNYFALLPARWAVNDLLVTRMQSPDADRGLLTNVQKALEQSLKNQVKLGPSIWGDNGLKNVEQINLELANLFRTHLQK